MSRRVDSIGKGPEFGTNYTAYLVHLYDHDWYTDRIDWKGGALGTTEIAQPYLGTNSWIRVSPEDASLGVAIPRQDVRKPVISGYLVTSYTKELATWNVPLEKGEFSLKSTGGSYINLWNDALLLGNGLTFTTYNAKDISQESYAQRHLWYTGDGRTTLLFGKEKRNSTSKSHFKVSIDDGDTFLKVGPKDSSDKELVSWGSGSWKTSLSDKGVLSQRYRGMEILTTKGIHLKGESVSMEALGSMVVSGASGLYLAAPQVSLGSGPPGGAGPSVPGEGIVLWSRLKPILEGLFTALQAHTHVDPVSGPLPVDPTLTSVMGSLKTAINGPLTSLSVTVTP